MFIDLKKALDLVNHMLPLHNLQLYGLHGTDSNNVLFKEKYASRLPPRSSMWTLTVFELWTQTALLSKMNIKHESNSVLHSDFTEKEKK